MMNRTYARNLAWLACVVVAVFSWSSSAIELWVLNQSTIPNIDAMRPLRSEHTWRFVQPMLFPDADTKLVESQISGLVDYASLLHEGWRSYAEQRVSRALWEFAAWSAVLICSLLLFPLRREVSRAA